jgi:hypothetical protein
MEEEKAGGRERERQLLADHSTLSTTGGNSLRSLKDKDRLTKEFNAVYESSLRFNW